MELTYSYITSAADVSEALIVTTGTEKKSVSLVNGHLQMPGIKDGFFMFRELEPGLAVLLADCTFSGVFKIIRKAKKINEYYGLHINLTTTPVIANKQSGRVVDIGTDWSNAVLFSSSAKGVEMLVPHNTRFIEVTLIMDYFWFKKHYQDAQVPEPMTQLRELKEDKPVQLTMDLTLSILSIAEDMLAVDFPEYLKTTYYTGECKKILALFLAELAVKPSRRKKEVLRLADVEGILHVRGDMERSITDKMPLMQDYCDALNMSKTKFNTLFRHVYGKTFSEVVLAVKMQQASELLAKGISSTDVAAMIGYKNASNFARVFRAHFKTTPKSYQSAEQFKVINSTKK
ncbi:MAG: helix-turn-helix transcriptional regulator [Filimonas sp.]|nr:helix-turn-helix transcriptional regulator [Filimonas sp.]